ncbi:PIN domain-containing protein [Natronorubrum halophilum]|uniref:PIN domain-containing protein n=1 Tax=Natronorubrum halophilum TaxID=1702106 RepID=UPI0010C1B2DD|nr:PIN domain-containing protein [Natronorubrum halophilum]
MIALDATFLIDYLEGVQSTADFLEEWSEPVYYAPAIVLYEIFEGAAAYDGGSIVDAEDSLDWIEPLEFDYEAARRAAILNSELLDDGSPINSADVLIAGTCLRHGAAVVTRDKHYEAVDDLETIRY